MKSEGIIIQRVVIWIRTLTFYTFLLAVALTAAAAPRIETDKAESMGKVIIRRKDGRTFALIPEQTRSSPLFLAPVRVI
jgi:hypothetical protein